MVEVTTTKPAASFFNQLLDNEPSRLFAVGSGERSRSDVTRVYPGGSNQQ